MQNTQTTRPPFVDTLIRKANETTAIGGCWTTYDFDLKESAQDFADFCETWGLVVGSKRADGTPYRRSGSAYLVAFRLPQHFYGEPAVHGEPCGACGAISFHGECGGEGEGICASLATRQDR